MDYARLLTNPAKQGQPRGKRRLKANLGKQSAHFITHDYEKFKLMVDHSHIATCVKED